MSLIALFRTAFVGWWNDRCLRMGAALSFYTTFSLAPLLLIANMTAGLFLGADTVRSAMISEFTNFIGKDPATALDSMLTKAGDFGSGFLSTGTGIILFIILATGAITELQDNLHEIWRREPDAKPMTLLVRSRLVSLALAAVVGFLLLVSLAISAGVTAVSSVIAPQLGHVTWLGAAAHLILSLLASTALFVAIFKILPEFTVPWREALVGSAMAAVLFEIGRYVIGFYIGRAGIAATYGPAGSLVTILLWIYYSSQILLFSAEFAKAYGEHREAARAE